MLICPKDKALIGQEGAIFLILNDLGNTVIESSNADEGISKNPAVMAPSGPIHSIKYSPLGITFNPMSEHPQSEVVRQSRYPSTVAKVLSII